MSGDIPAFDDAHHTIDKLNDGMVKYVVVLAGTPEAAKAYLEGRGATMEWRDGEITRLKVDTPEGVQIAGQVAQAQIRSRTIMRLGLYILACFLCVAAALIIVFAPNGREQLSAIMAAALFVVAVGSAGFSTFALKAPLVSATAGDAMAPASKPVGKKEQV